ncbi:hypothetical protein CANCADRAFT_28330, partial [Tortispora caseinolytica NRRL Y-17796]
MADEIRLLISSDNHVGYNENDPIRGNDSWQTFNEIMGYAKTRDVDGILLGGDLFHSNEPSRVSMYRVLTALRETCLGDKPCELEFLGDPATALTGEIKKLNYEDENVNVAIPVFTIAGNHDDSTGADPSTVARSAVDVLASTRLVNHFGFVSKDDTFVVHPILLRKGDTFLALYGLSNVREERMHRCFRDGKVKFMRPHCPGVSDDSWFNILVLHQNRSSHSSTDYIPQSALPPFVDLVLWGHEHECLIDPQYVVEKELNIIQPGSSVATSLCQAEAVPKYTAIISIRRKRMDIEKIRLKTVRPFVFRTVELKQKLQLQSTVDMRSQAEKYLTDEVNSMIAQAKNEWVQAQKEGTDGTIDIDTENCPLPLIRLRVDHKDCKIGNAVRFSNTFAGKVANPKNVLSPFVPRKT